jgi:hypothetical protein
MMTADTRALVARLAELLSNERVALADFLATLAGFDRERRWEEAGYANLYDFLVRELRDGRLCITAVHALSKAITPENRVEVLPRFFRVSTREAKVVAAEFAPAPTVPRREVVTMVRPAPVLDFGHVSQAIGKLPERPASEPALEELVPPPPARSTVEPLTAQDRRLHLTVSPEFLSMLEACKDALTARRRRSSRSPGQRRTRSSFASTPATSPPRSVGRSGSETRGSASGRWRAAASAARPSSLSWTTSTGSSPVSPSRRRT